jgi:hypothetical protein
VAFWFGALCVTATAVLAARALKGWIGATNASLVGAVAIALALLVFSLGRRGRKRAD